MNDESIESGMAVLNRILKANYFTYYPSLARLAGSPKAGLMLGHALYFSKALRKTKNVRNGWFYMGGADWLKATGLSLYEQSSARKKLCNNSVRALMKSERIGTPARLWYRIHLDSIYAGIGGNNRDVLSTPLTMSMFDDMGIKTLLGRFLLFYPILAHACGDSIIGIYVSHLINEYQFKLQSNQVDQQGYAYTPDTSAWDMLFLGERSVRHAREYVESKQLIQFKRSKSMFGRLQYRLNIESLVQYLNDFKQKNAVCSDDTSNLTSDDTSNLTSDDTSNLTSDDTSNLTSDDTSNLTSDVFLYQATNKSHNIIRVLENTNNLLPPPVVEDEKSASNNLLDKSKNIVVGFNEYKKEENSSSLIDLNSLIIPSIFLEAEYSTLKNILSKSQNPQLVLDEVLGQSNKRPIESPCAYLRNLVTKELSGELIYAHAHQIQHKRALAGQSAKAVKVSNQLADQKIHQASQEETERGREVLARFRSKWQKEKEVT